jgi:hypothetical protein
VVTARPASGGKAAGDPGLVFAKVTIFSGLNWYYQYIN